MDNVLKVNIVNFLTVGVMAFIFVYVADKAVAKFAPRFALVKQG